MPQIYGNKKKFDAQSLSSKQFPEYDSVLKPENFSKNKSQVKSDHDYNPLAMNVKTMQMPFMNERIQSLKHKKKIQIDDLSYDNTENNRSM